MPRIIYLDLTTSNMEILQKSASLIRSQLAQIYTGVEDIWFDRHILRRRVPLLRSNNFKRTDLLYLTYNESYDIPFSIKIKTIHKNGKELKIVYATLDADFIQLDRDQLSEFEMVSYDLNLVEFSPGFGSPPVISTDSASNIMRLTPSHLLLNKDGSETYHPAKAAVWDVAQAVREGRGSIPTYTTFYGQEHLILVMDPIERFEARSQILSASERTRFIRKNHRAPEFLRKNFKRDERNHGDRYGHYHDYDSQRGNYRHYGDYREDPHSDDEDDWGSDDDRDEGRVSLNHPRIHDKSGANYSGKSERRKSKDSSREKKGEKQKPVKEEVSARTPVGRDRRTSSVPPKCKYLVDWREKERLSRQPKSEAVVPKNEPLLTETESKTLLIRQLVGLQMSKMGYGGRGNPRYQGPVWNNPGGHGGYRGGYAGGRGRGTGSRASRSSPYPQDRGHKKWDSRAQEDNKEQQSRARQEENAQLPDVDWDKISKELGAEFTDYVITLGAKSNRKTLFSSRYRSPGLGYGWSDEDSCYVDLMEWDPFSDPAPKDLDTSLSTCLFESYQFRRVPDEKIGEANLIWKRMLLANSRLREIVAAATDMKKDVDFEGAVKCCDDEVRELTELGAGMGDGSLGARLTVHVLYQVSSLCTLFEVFKALLNREVLTDLQKVQYQYAYASISNAETFGAIQRHHISRFHDGSDDGKVESVVDEITFTSSEDEMKVTPFIAPKHKTPGKKNAGPSALAPMGDLNTSFQRVLDHCAKYDREIAEMNLEQLENAMTEHQLNYYKYSRENPDQSMLWQTEVMLSKLSQQRAHLEKKKPDEIPGNVNLPPLSNSEQADQSREEDKSGSTDESRSTPGNDNNYANDTRQRGEGQYFRPHPPRRRFYPN